MDRYIYIDYIDTYIYNLIYKWARTEPQNMFLEFAGVWCHQYMA